jgi:two-component system CheB/CheR fusion protein
LKAPVTSKEKVSVISPARFPIVGIGASAGGLEALEQFLGNVPEKSGMAFVVIQHLDPTQKGMLPELLQRITKLEVVPVKDLLKVKPDCVYVIPPNKSMSVFKGVLHLFEPIESRGLRLPVDFFLRSLADDQNELGVGVILSGMGSDGSAGIMAIKEKNGIVMVQEPATAKYDSMPGHAIESGLVDIVAPANLLPGRLIEFLRHLPEVRVDLDKEVKDKSSLDKIILLLRTYTGNDFSLYKKNTVYRRIERRMGVHRIDKIASYVHFLQENPKEANILFKELMIGVTSFFRDSAVWEKSMRSVIPEIIDKVQHDTVLRAWIAGCSTGEEAYSLAIVFKEALEKTNPHAGISLQIFATDLDNEAIETARKGLFPPNIVSDVSSDRLARFFVRTEDGFRVKTEIREMIVFAQHNIVMHPPFTRIDFLSCRNLLIYVDTELQRKLLGMFYYSINPEGILLLGSSETLGTQSHLFTPLDVKLKIFRRSTVSFLPELTDFPSSFTRTKPTVADNQLPVNPNLNIQTLADQLLLKHFAPAGVLVNENGDIIYFSGRTGKYLEPAVGKANLNIFAMLREGLREEFPAAFRKAIMKKEAVILRNVKVGTNGSTLTLQVNIQWIDKPGPLYGTVLIVFNDVPENANPIIPAKTGKKTSVSTRELELENDLQRTREEMQNILEEMQTSQEELKSTNEELQSTNEELQSTNEELTTSKEEMQSLNEELQTTNAELQSKVDDFLRANNDMKNLLNSTDIATLFLDKELNIRRFTFQATKIFKLIKSDIGRPFTDQVSDLIYPGLSADALEVIETLALIQKQIPTKDGRWFHTRIMPYRTSDDRIDGLVITFVNITDLKEIEIKLHESEQVNNTLIQSSSDIILTLTTDWKITAVNHAAEKFFGKKSADLIHQNYYMAVIPEPDQKKTERELSKLLKAGQDAKIEMQVIDAAGFMPVMEWAVHVVRNIQNQPSEVIMIAKIY